MNENKKKASTRAPLAANGQAEMHFAQPRGLPFTCMNELDEDDDDDYDDAAAEQSSSP